MQFTDVRMKLYQEIQVTSPENLKKLNQQERSTALIALRSLNQNKFISESEINEDHIETILKTLKNSEQKKRRLKEVLINRFNLGIGSHQLLDEVNQIGSKIKELEGLSQKIEKQQTKLKELNDLSRFQTEDALPLYRDIKGFYESLPCFMQKTEDILIKKIKEVNDRIKKAKENKKDAGYIYILEKEILTSLTKFLNKFQTCQDKATVQRAILEELEKFKEQKVQNSGGVNVSGKVQGGFTRELELMKQAWKRAVDECTQRTLTVKAIDETKQQITEYQQRQKELQAGPIGQLYNQKIQTLV